MMGTYYHVASDAMEEHKSVETKGGLGISVGAMWQQV